MWAAVKPESPRLSFEGPMPKRPICSNGSKPMELSYRELTRMVFSGPSTIQIRMLRMTRYISRAPQANSSTRTALAPSTTSTRFSEFPRRRGLPHATGRYDEAASRLRCAGAIPTIGFAASSASLDRRVEPLIRR